MQKNINSKSLKKNGCLIIINVSIQKRERGKKERIIKILDQQKLKCIKSRVILEGTNFGP